MFEKMQTWDLLMKKIVWRQLGDVKGKNILPHHLDSILSLTFQILNNTLLKTSRLISVLANTLPTKHNNDSICFQIALQPMNQSLKFLQGHSLIKCCDICCIHCNQKQATSQKPDYSRFNVLEKT